MASWNIKNSISNQLILLQTVIEQV